MVYRLEGRAGKATPIACPFGVGLLTPLCNVVSEYQNVELGVVVVVVVEEEEEEGGGGGGEEEEEEEEESLFKADAVNEEEEEEEEGLFKVDTVNWEEDWIVQNKSNCDAFFLSFFLSTSYCRRPGSLTYLLSFVIGSQ